MKPNTFAWAALAAGILATGGVATPAHAQSTDALLNKLVDKGILTKAEADDLRKESEKDFAKAYATKTGTPDWVTSIKFSGDFRGRFEGFYGSDDNFVDRNRFRYRLRLGTTVVMKDHFELGLRLSSAEASGTFGGDPISANTTFQDNGSKKFVFIDLAYGKWTGLKAGDLTGALTIGKMENPFVFSSMVFDHDYTPEGIAAQFVHKLNNAHALKLNLGGFALDEIGGQSEDPYLVGAQLRFDSTWTPEMQTSAGIAALGIMGDENLVNGAVPNINRGNTRTPVGADFRPAYNFNPIIGDLSFTYSFKDVPGYKGTFPVKVFGDALVNPAAPSDQNKGYDAGVMFGKSGKKGQWDISYTWRYQQADSWYEEFTESDFGAFHSTQAAGAGFATAANPLGRGYGAGTNVKGHILKLNYSVSDSFTVGLSWFATSLIDRNQPGTANPPGTESDMNRVQVDAVWKF